MAARARMDNQTQSQKGTISMASLTRQIGPYVLGMGLLALLALATLAAYAPQKARVPPAALIIADVFVDPVRGNDANGGWSPDKPLKTLAQALAKVKPGCTIHLAKGVYSKATNGEQFSTSRQQVLAPADVTIEGATENSGGVQIAVSMLQGTGSEIGLNFAGDATVRNLVLTGFNRGIVATKTRPSLSGVVVTDNGSIQP